MTLDEAHRLARGKGVSRPLYALVRALVGSFVRVWYGLRIFGAEHIPPSGAAIIAPNHKSLYDSFFIAMATKRHLRFMGKSELFEGRWGRLLVRLGAFPVRRGAADADALETARVILRQGGLLSLFPEGTRFRDPETLTRPRRGAARIAIETGAPLVPSAITGTERLFFVPAAAARAGVVCAGDQLAGPGSDAEGGRGADRGARVAGGAARVRAPAGAADGDRGRARRARHRRRRGLPAPPGEASQGTPRAAAARSRPQAAPLIAEPAPERPRALDLGAERFHLLGERAVGGRDVHARRVGIVRKQTRDLLVRGVAPAPRGEHDGHPRPPRR
jgi:1-acyl-sn-glycerol-3-phosphate acyltransferase